MQYCKIERKNVVIKFISFIPEEQLHSERLSWLWDLFFDVATEMGNENICL